MSSDRAVALAEEFAAANADVIRFARSCSEAHWKAMVPGEEWPVGVVIHHIAVGYTNGQGWLETMIRGDAVTTTRDDIDHVNVEHAAEHADVGIAVTVALLETNGATLEALLRGLTDEQLDQLAPFGPADGRSLPASQLAGVSAQHALGHLGHAMEAVSGND
jgi:hypothetical protein